MQKRTAEKVTLGIIVIVLVLTVGLTACSNIYTGKETGEMQQVDSKVVTITNNNFEAEIGSGVALVDFWAEWCGPCRTQGPIIEKVAREMDGKVTVGKLNVDEERETAVHFSIRSIPTLVIFKDGKEVERLIGLQQEKTLLDKLSTHSAQTS